jgi:hypothetical protein
MPDQLAIMAAIIAGGAVTSHGIGPEATAKASIAIAKEILKQIAAENPQPPDNVTGADLDQALTELRLKHGLKHETVHYSDGSSATGVAPLPRFSPEGAPAINEGTAAGPEASGPQ